MTGADTRWKRSWNVQVTRFASAAPPQAGQGRTTRTWNPDHPAPTPERIKTTWTARGDVDLAVHADAPIVVAARNQAGRSKP